MECPDHDRGSVDEEWVVEGEFPDTIAYLEGSERVETQHVAEAVQYRLLDRKA